MEEEFVTLAEVKVLLDREKEARGQISPEQQYSLSHATSFARLDFAKAQGMMKELMAVPMMSPGNAAKIVDLLPSHLDDVRAIFAKERFSLSKEDAEKVLEIVAKYQ